MDFDFSIIGVSETWLRDWNCDLYNIEGYELVESHRPVRTGGGVGIYLKLDIDLKAFNDAMHDLLNAIKRENKIFYLKGDYDIKLLNYVKHNETNECVDMMHAHSFISLINRPIRVNQQSATLIDNIFTNKHDDLVNTF